MRAFVLGVLLTLVLLAGSVVAASRLGLVPIGADNPPGSLARMLAARAMDVYAERHKPAGDNPVAPTSENPVTGAHEYEEHCAFCHGGAKARISPMQAKFSPPAPQLINRIPHDEDAWLFRVTKHGVRMTGMPTWDAILSDDEMWKVMAFIKDSDTLPPGVQASWQEMAGEPGAIEEHTPAQHTGTPSTGAVAHQP